MMSGTSKRLKTPDTPLSARRGLSRPARRGGALAVLAAAFLFVGCQDLDNGSARRPAAGSDRSAAERAAASQRIDLNEVGYQIGNPEASVIVVEFSDFGCHFCRSFALQSFPTIKREYIDTGKVSWRYVPYILGIFPNGDRAAIAGVCAAAQGADEFWAMHDLLYERQDDWKSTGGGAREIFTGYAADLGLDAGSFANCYDNNLAAEEINANLRIGRQMGVRATPTFFINGARVEGAIPVDLFMRVLDEAMEL